MSEKKTKFRYQFCLEITGMIKLIGKHLKEILKGQTCTMTREASSKGETAGRGGRGGEEEIKHTESGGQRAGR